MPIEPVTTRRLIAFLTRTFHSYRYMVSSRQMTIVSEQPQDGRQQRSQRTHAAVARAMIDCIRDGTLRPSAKQVALRAGVSTRAVFRHFENMEALLLEATHIHLDAIAPLVPPIETSGNLDSRIRSSARHWTTFFEHSEEIWRSTILALPFSQLLQGFQIWQRAVIAEQLQSSFAPEFKAMKPTTRNRREQNLRALISDNYWAELRDHQKLSVAESKRSIEEALQSLLTS